jgi:hypothetical protein
VGRAFGRVPFPASATRKRTKKQSKGITAMAVNDNELRQLKVLQSANGYFIGTVDDGINRLSFEYWTTKEAADYALKCYQWTPHNSRSSAWVWGD